MKEQDRICEMLRAALALEDKGRAFYEQAAKKCELPECKRIFKQLAEDETLHQKRIQMLSDALTAGESWCDWRDAGQTDPEVQRVIDEVAKKYGQEITPSTTDVQALSVAVGLEADSIKYYSKERDNSHFRLEKQFLAQLIQEEIVHYRTLMDMKFYFENPTGWFRERERHMMDG
jgi:rubrerythrin